MQTLRKGRGLLKGLNLFVVFCFAVSMLSFDLINIKSAQASGLNLPAPAQFVPLSSAYSFPVLKGLKFDPAKPFSMQFIIDGANKEKITKEDIAPLVNYFLAALTIPEEDLWVNLSPYEKDRITSPDLAQTGLGKELLSQDYILKQLTSSLTYPESDTGKVYWDNIYKEVARATGTTNLPIDTFSKVWIVPDKAQVHENETTALITKASLKVLSEQDYLAMRNHPNQNTEAAQSEQINKIASEAMKKVILPKINQDVNKGKNFSQLRQIYHSIILGTWFKKKFKQSIYKHYIDQGKLKGIDLKDKFAKDKIYQLYVEAFKKGMYDYIKPNYDPNSGKNIKRRYYSGGAYLAVGNILQGGNLSAQTPLDFMGNMFFSGGELDAVKAEISSSSAIEDEVVIGHSETEDYLGVTAEQAHAQSGTFLESGYKVMLPAVDDTIIEMPASSSSLIINDKILEKAYKRAKEIGEYQIFGPGELFARKSKESPQAEEIAKELWLKYDNIDRVYIDGDEGDFWYIYSPLSIAVQLAPDARPEDFPSGVPMRVVIGHSEVRDYLGMTTEQIRLQLEAFLDAGFKVILPWGDFPVILKGKNYLKTGQRKFPVNFENIETMAIINRSDPEYQALLDEIQDVQNANDLSLIPDKYNEVRETLIPTLRAEIDKLIESIEKEFKGKEEELVLKVKTALREQYPKHYRDSYFGTLYDLEQVKNLGREKLIFKMINDLAEVKARIIREISNIHEINSQIRILFKGLPIEQVTGQIALPYEPVEGIRTVAICDELQELRLKRMIPVMVRAGIPDDISLEGQTNLPSDRTKAIRILRGAYKKVLESLFIYGGGANDKNIEQVSGRWKGAFIGRASLDPIKAVKIVAAAAKIKERKETIIFNFKAAMSGPYKQWLQGYKDAGLDLENGVKVIHAVSMLDAYAAYQELTGWDSFFLDRAKAGEPGKKIITYAGAEVATQEVGAFNGHIPAKFLWEAGATHALLDVTGYLEEALSRELIETQINNLTEAGITPVVVSRRRYDDSLIESFTRGISSDSAEKVEIIKVSPKEPFALTPISQVRSVYAGSVSSSSLSHKENTAWQGGGIAMEGVEKQVQALPASSPINIPAGFIGKNLSGLQWHFGFMTKIKNNQELEKILGIRQESEKELSHLPQ